MKKFIYIHIPKAAGTSMFLIFKSAFGKERIFRDITFKKEHKLTFGRMEELLPPGFVNRFVMSDRSYPRNIRNFDKINFDIILGHFTIDKYKHIGWPFVTFMRDPIDRLLSEYVIWRNRFQNERESLTDFAAHNPNLMTWMIGGDLKRLKFVGIVERFEESVEKLSNILEVPLQGKIKTNISARKHKRYKKYQPSLREIEKIKIYNKLDIDLYNWAMRRL